MAKKGGMFWIPETVRQEVEDIQREDRIIEREQAFKRMTEYARVGREIKRIAKLDWSKKAVLPPIPPIWKDKPKKKRGFF